jgi:hypothetical protein
LFNCPPNPADFSASSPITSSGDIIRDAAPLAPIKALKTRVRATPHTAPQPLLVVDIVAAATKLQEAMARGAQKAQQARAPESEGDAGQGGAVAAAQANAEGEVGQGGANDATRPDVEVEAGRGAAVSATQPAAGEGTGGGAQERPASQREAETQAPEPSRDGVEGVTEKESAPARAGDEGAVAAATAQTTPKNVVPVVRLPESSDKFEDSRDINPAAAASAADRIGEFVSASEEILGAGMSEGPHHGAIIQSGVPLEFLCNE